MADPTQPQEVPRRAPPPAMDTVPRQDDPEETNAQELEEGRLPAILGYVPFLFFVPLFGAKGNSFAYRHGRQAAAICLVEVVALLFLIDTISQFVWTVVFVACLALALVAGMNAAQGKFWKIPYLDEFLQKYDIFGGS